MFENFRFNMLNKKAASPKSKPAEILKALDIHEGVIIGDIGTGGGYFTFEFSGKVGKKGKVYAIDTNRKSLDYIENKSKKEGIKNIEIVLANENKFSLPEKVDILFLRNVFHHLPEPTEYFKTLKQCLKYDGRIVIIDYNKKGFSFIGISGHYEPDDVVIDKLEKAGFNVHKRYDFLPEQSFLIFKMNDKEI